MNIQDLYVNSRGVQSKKTMFSSEGSLLSLGKKGDKISGTVAKVADQVTMRFGKMEVNLPKNALSSPEVGQKRDFEIEDISKDHIVLKELHQTSSVSARGQVNTTVSANNYSFEKCLENGKKTLEGDKQANQNIKLVTGNDYEDIEEEEGSVRKQTQEGFDRAVERIKEKNAWNEKCQEANLEFRDELQEGLEKCQKTGAMDHKTKEQLKQLLLSSNLPATDEMVQKIVSALNMSHSANQLDDNAKVSLLASNQSPTIENIYQSQYSGGMAKDASQVSEELWSQMEPQVEKLLSENGLEGTEVKDAAKWLFANNIPVTVEKINQLAVLDSIKDNRNDMATVQQIMMALSNGLEAEQASLDTESFIIAKDQVTVWGDVDDQAVTTAVSLSEEENSPVTLQFLRKAMDENASGQEASGGNAGGQNDSNFIANQTEEKLQKEITVKRQVVEIQLKMTVQSVMTFRNKGIDIETAPLEKLVEELREQENAFYKEFIGIAGGEAAKLNDDAMKLFQNTMEANREISAAPAYRLGTCVKQQALLTWGEFHGQITVDGTVMQRYEKTFEAVGTQVRSDLGDSMNKAFDSVPELLKEMGLEDTKANERAVRILGYNQMEITKTSVSEMKIFDQKVNHMIDAMKPSVVLQMIRDGINPLDEKIDDLSNIVDELAKKQDTSSDEKYSKYLWQLEKDHAITEEERKGYIGIYRLLHQIESSDGAAIGAVLDSEQEMTLGHLLTAVRTRKGDGVNAKVDDEFGALTSLKFPGESITAQIQSAFLSDGQNGEYNNNGNAEQTKQNNIEKNVSTANANILQENQDKTEYLESEYYENLVMESMDTVTPSKIQEISDGDMQTMLSMSLEKFAEKLKGATGRRELESSYYEEQAEEIRQVAADGADAVSFLNTMGIPDTMENIQALELSNTEFNIWNEVEKRKKVLPDEEREELEKAIEELSGGEALSDEASMQTVCEKVELEMQNILEKSYEQADITYDDLQELKQFGQSLQLNHLLSHRRSYDIPVQTKEGMTEMNVTIVQGTGEKGKVSIRLEDLEGYGTIGMELQADGTAIKGLLLCDERQGFEKLADQKEIMEEILKENGFEVKSLSVAMDQKSKMNMAEAQTVNDTDTVNLYRLAKGMVQYFSALAQAE